MSAFDSSPTPLKFGPGVRYSDHPSGQCCPVAAGPFSTVHFRRSKLARWLLPASAVQTTPLRSMSMPRGRYALTRDRGLLNGGSYTSASAVAAGFGPGTTRMMAPGTPGAAVQTEPSTGLGITPELPPRIPLAPAGS